MYHMLFCTTVISNKWLEKNQPILTFIINSEDYYRMEELMAQTRLSIVRNVNVSCLHSWPYVRLNRLYHALTL